MNIIYKTILNRNTGCSVVTSELAKGKVKGKVAAKGVISIIGMGLSIFGGAGAFANTLSIVNGDKIVVQQDTIYSEDGSSGTNYVWSQTGGELTVGDNVTLVMDSNSVTNGFFGVGNSKTTQDIIFNAGNNFTITNNTTGGASSAGFSLYLGSSSPKFGGAYSFGDNLKITANGQDGKSTGLRVAGANVAVDIGNNAYISGQAAALTMSNSAGTGMTTVNIGSNATLLGKVALGTNSNMILGDGSSLILNEDLLSIYRANSTYSSVLLGLNGSGINFSAKNVYFNLNDSTKNTSELPWRVNGAVIRIANNNMQYGDSSIYENITDGYNQKLVLDGANVRIGATDEFGGALRTGDLLQVVLSSHYKNATTTGNSFIHLKDVKIESAGGHLVYVANSDFDQLSDGSYSYLASDGNKATIILDNVDGTSQTSGIYLENSGNHTSLIDLALTNGTKVVGGLTNDSAGDINLSLSNNADVTGNIINNGAGDINVAINDTTTVTGDVVNNSDTGNLDVIVNTGGALNGNVIKNGEADLNLVVNEGGKWTGSGVGVGLWVKANSSYTLANSSSSFTNVKMDDNSLLDFGAPVSESTFKTLHSAGDMTQSGSAASVYMSTNLGLGKGDLIAVDGELTGNYIVSVNNYGASPSAPNQALRIIQSGNGSTENDVSAVSAKNGNESAATVALTGNQYRDAGLYRYHLVQDNSGAGYWLVNGDGSGTNYGGGDDDLSKSGNAYNADGSINFAGFTAPVGAEKYSDLARTLKSTAASQTVSMLNQSRNVAKHIDGIRQAGVKGDHATTAWVNHFYNDSKIDASVAGTESKLNMNATYLGADKSWDLGNGDTFVAGVFAGAGFADNDYRINGSKGDSDIYTGGIYGMWLDDSGLFADMTAQVYRVKTQSNAYTEQGQRTDYDIVSHAFGLNLDIGKRYELDDGFYIEPELKLAYLRDGSDEFTTRGASNLKAKKTAADVFQYGAGLSLGKTIATATPGSSIQPYLNIELLGQSINGGDIESSGTRLDNDLSGHQLRSDLGVNWQINKKHRLFAEVSAGTGETYSNTFSAGLGYQMKF
ncbi:autotransporter outer membrane beta-barrel domain-containing protein [Aeromonas enteropelogenes]|uniref:autotransporter outer membrane beta-barrel domain-containing protein n=1 Tax=Aeromonas enteropelogenes TaxID=29489 RepID=UPI003BA061A8